MAVPAPDYGRDRVSAFRTVGDCLDAGVEWWQFEDDPHGGNQVFTSVEEAQAHRLGRGAREMSKDTTALPDHVLAWAHDIAGKFRKHQAGDPFSQAVNGRVLRPEEQLVEYVLKALAEGGCPATASVLEEVDYLRAGMREVA